MNKLKSIFGFVKQVAVEFFTDNVLKYSASLSYYTVFALAPMIIIILAVLGFFFGENAMQGEIYSQIGGLVGKKAALQIQETIKSTRLSGETPLATTLSIIFLVIAATGIFGEIQDSLNKIWGLRIGGRRKWWKLILDRIQSFSLIISLGFIMMVSLLLNAMVAALSKYMQNVFKGSFPLFIVDQLVSFLIAVFLFAVIYKVLPDAKIKWKDVTIGAIFTAVMFTLGKYAIGLYIGQRDLASLYGAAGSIVIIMIWTYYSSVILYLGAEFTKVYARLYGGKIQPNAYSEWIKIEKKHADNIVLNKEVLE